MTYISIIVFRNNARFSIGYLGADGPIRIKHFSHSKKNAWYVILKETVITCPSLCKLKIYSINDNKQNKVKNLVSYGIKFQYFIKDGSKWITHESGIPAKDWPLYSPYFNGLVASKKCSLLIVIKSFIEDFYLVTFILRNFDTNNFAMKNIRICEFHESKLWGIKRGNLLSVAQMKVPVYVKFNYQITPTRHFLRTIISVTQYPVYWRSNFHWYAIPFIDLLNFVVEPRKPPKCYLVIIFSIGQRKYILLLIYYVSTCR